MSITAEKFNETTLKIKDVKNIASLIRLVVHLDYKSC